VEFDTHLGSDRAFPNAIASVTHYQNQPGNVTMMRERVGDRVQVCFLGAPEPTRNCDPDKDSRGRKYRVYDYRHNAQYWGYNSEHGCGGA